MSTKLDIKNDDVLGKVKQMESTLISPGTKRALKIKRNTNIINSFANTNEQRNAYQLLAL